MNVGLGRIEGIKISDLLKEVSLDSERKLRLCAPETIYDVPKKNIVVLMRGSWHEEHYGEQKVI